MADEQTQRSRRPTWYLAIFGGAGLLAGFALGKPLVDLSKAMHAGRLSWSEVAALWIGLGLVGSAATTLALLAARPGRALLDDPRTPDFKRPVGGARIIAFALQAGVMLLAGVLLVAPIGVKLAGAVKTTGLAVFLAVVVGFALQSALNLELWRRSDEVQRRAITEAGAVCFWTLQGALFLWACGEKLSLLPTLTSWDAITVLMGVYLAVSTVIVYRNGLA